MKAKSKTMKEEDVQKHPDHGIDRDYPGFPHAPSSKKTITPKTSTDKKTASLKKKTSRKTYGR